MTKTTKEIPIPSNILQRKSSRPHKKSRVVLENEDLLTEEEFIKESTEELYIHLHLHIQTIQMKVVMKTRKIIRQKWYLPRQSAKKKHMKRISSDFWNKCDICFKCSGFMSTALIKGNCAVSSIKRLKAWK